MASTNLNNRWPSESLYNCVVGDRGSQVIIYLEARPLGCHVASFQDLDQRSWIWGARTWDPEAKVHWCKIVDPRMRDSRTRAPVIWILIPEIHAFENLVLEGQVAKNLNRRPRSGVHVLATEYRRLGTDDRVMATWYQWPSIHDPSIHDLSSWSRDLMVRPPDIEYMWPEFSDLGNQRTKSLNMRIMTYEIDRPPLKSIARIWK